MESKSPINTCEIITGSLKNGVDVALCYRVRVPDQNINKDICDYIDVSAHRRWPSLTVVSSVTYYIYKEMCW